MHEAGGDWGRVWMASVVDPETENRLVHLIEARAGAGVPIERVRARASACGVRSAYEDPHRLGADRWAALVGAWARTRSSTLILSVGTAVTCDALDGTGRHLGGLIAPGRMVLARALAEQTARLPEIRHAGERHWGRSTEEAIANGIAVMLDGFVEEIDGLMENGHEVPPRRLLTGGDVDGLGGAVRSGWEWVPSLVFDGLACLADES